MCPVRPFGYRFHFHYFHEAGESGRGASGMAHTDRHSPTQNIVLILCDDVSTKLDSAEHMPKVGEIAHTDQSRTHISALSLSHTYTSSPAPTLALSNPLFYFASNSRTLYFI